MALQRLVAEPQVPERFPDVTAHNVAFGFAASLLESIPFIGIAFTVSNRIGACMWAFGELHHTHPDASQLT